MIEAEASRIKPNKKKSDRPQMKAHIWDGSVNIRQNWIYKTWYKMNLFVNSILIIEIWSFYPVEEQKCNEM